MAATDHARGWATHVDFKDQLRIMRRVSGAMFVYGALSGLAGALVLQHGSGRLWQAIFSACFLCLGLVVLAAPRLWLFGASTLLSIVIVSGLVATSEPVGMTSLSYLWPVLYAAYFLSRRLLVASFWLMVVTMAPALALNTSLALKFDTFAGTVSTVGVIAVLVAFMQRRERRLREDLDRAAHTDPLTGLLNRRAFNPKLEALIADAALSDRAVSVAMFDVDHFKRFNDQHGHIAGDNALVRVATLLREHSKEGDLVARFGGEEFAVALPGADAVGARRYAERVGGVLHAEGIDTHLALSISAGIATLTPEFDTLDALISHADDALYAAKHAGRARAAWWDGTIQIGAEAGRLAAVAV